MTADTRSLRHRYISLFVIFSVLITLVPAALCADGMDSIDPALLGTWRWIGATTPVAVLEPVEGEEYQVVFTEDGSIHMKVEINRINGTYEADGKKLSIKPPMMMTMAAWHPESPAPALLLLMEHASGYFFSDSKLYIDSKADAGTMELIRE